MTKLLIIAGATCTGKSSLAVECAKKYNGEIISCDSMQIYKGCDIGTAKITTNEQQGIVHHMLSIVSPKEEFSVSEYVDRVKFIIQEIESKGKLPIIVGGTGLYIQALLNNYNFCNTEKNELIREKYNNILQEKGKDYLFKLLCDKDSEKAKKINKNDTKRIIRSLEILENNQKMIKESECLYDYLFIVLNFDRGKLYEKINHRVEDMINSGLEAEVEGLLSSGISFNNQCMQSIGYKEWAPYFKGEIDKSELIENIKKNTRHYAKRQVTWFRHRENAKIFDIETQQDKIFEEIECWLKL